MGYSTIIAAAFAAIIMLTGLATILTTGLTTMEELTGSITEQVQTSEEKLSESCKLGNVVEVDAHTLRVNVTNTGDAAISVKDLSTMDVLAIYRDASGKNISWVAYDQDGSGEYWKIRSVYFDDGVEVTNPVNLGVTSYGVWDPLEAMEIEVHLNATVTEFESIVVTLPGGFRAIQSSALSSNWGEATVVAGSTTLTVSHGLSDTPANVQLTPESNIAGSYWVSSIDSTSFSINLSEAQGGDVSFYWFCQK